MSDHDLAGLIQFVVDGEWKAQLEAVMGEHFGPAMAEFDLAEEEIGAFLGEPWAMTLFGCVFEDLLTRAFEPDGRTVVDAYLERHGRNESAPAKAYMAALQRSTMSLYEASEIKPGQSFLARDLLRGGEPILVSETSATRTLKTWERIAARIVPLGGKPILAGGLLPFSMEAAETLPDGLRLAAGERSRRTCPQGVRSTKRVIDDDTLRALAPLFTTAWLFDVLPRAMGEREPVLYNSDGDAVVFHQVRWPFAAGVTQKDVAPRLDALPELRKETARFWNWLGDPALEQPQAGPPADALTWRVSMEDGAVVLGSIELKGRALLLSVNSASRATRGMALVQAALDDLVRPPLTEIQTVEQMRTARSDAPSPSTDIPPEMATEIVHAMLDQHYCAALDQPVPMLGDISPREAARTPAGRDKVAAWLKYLENRSANRDPADPIATYDFGWMWRELGVAKWRR